MKPKNTVENINIRRAIDLLAEGKDLESVEKETGIDRKVFGRREVKEAINKFLEDGAFKDDVVRATVRAARFKIFTQLASEGLEEGNLNKLRLASDVGNEIAMDTNIAIKAPPRTEIVLQTENISSLLEKKPEEIIAIETDMEEIKE